MGQLASTRQGVAVSIIFHASEKISRHTLSVMQMAAVVPGRKYAEL
jgi:hypothetical protein